MTAEMMGSGEVGPGRGGRMSRQRKTAAVLRLLRGEDLETVSRGEDLETVSRGEDLETVSRGEDLETVSRALGVTAATLSGWRDAFLTAGETALTTRPGTGEGLAAARLKAKLGEALIERDLLTEKIAALEAGRPLAGQRRKR